MASCGGCEKVWSSLSWAHCGVCHETFVGVAYFDWHRFGGVCWSQKCGEFPYADAREWWFHKDSYPVLRLEDEVWSTAEGHDNRKVVAERLAKAREKRGRKVVAESP